MAPNVVDLPLPRAGFVDTVFHLADTHIRTGDDEICRRVEYADVFSKLIKSVGAHPAAKAGSCVTLIAGDLFHSKTRYEPRGIQLFNDLLQGLTTHGPVFVFEGNHDRSSTESRDAPSLVSSELATTIRWIERSGGECRIAFMADTGSYRCGNLGFGLVAIRDALRAGNTRGYEEVMPAFPPASDLPPDVTFKMCLFHGPVTSACPLPGGRTLGGVSLEWFGPGYDACLLGDVHIMMCKNCDELPLETQQALPPSFNAGTYSLPQRVGLQTPTMPWAFAGSTVQQNMSESLFGHGFLVWSLTERTVSKHHVLNEHGLVTVRKHDERGWTLCAGSQRVSSSQAAAVWVSPADAALHLPWLPKSLTVRVVGEDVSAVDVMEVGVMLGSAGMTVRSIYHQDFVGEGAVHADPSPADGLDQQAESMAYFNTPQAWIAHMTAEGSPDDVPWEALLRDPELTHVPAVPEAVAAMMTAKALDAARTRRQDIARGATAYQLATGRNGDAMRRAPLKIVSVEWKYMLCFGTDNWLNFRSLSGRVALLSGHNGVGKSSLLEVVTYILFSEGMPSRAVKSQSAAVVCIARPAGERAVGSIVLEVGVELFQITRPINVTDGVASSSDATVERVTPDPTSGVVGRVEVASGKGAVEAWVTRHVGDMDSFLSSTMLTQHNDNDFFSKKGKEQVEQLDDILGNAVIASAVHVIHKASVSHQVTLREVQQLQSVVVQRGAPVAAVASLSVSLEEQRRVLVGAMEELEARQASGAAVWQTVDPGLAETVAGGRCDTLSSELERLCSEVSLEPTTQTQTDVGEQERQLACMEERARLTTTSGALDPRPSDVLASELGECRANEPDAAQPERTEVDVTQMAREEAAWRASWAPQLPLPMLQGGVDACDGRAEEAAARRGVDMAQERVRCACRYVATTKTRMELQARDVEREAARRVPAPVGCEDVSLSREEAEEAARGAQAELDVLLRHAAPRPAWSAQELERQQRLLLQAHVVVVPTSSGVLEDSRAAVVTAWSLRERLAVEAASADARARAADEGQESAHRAWIATDHARCIPERPTPHPGGVTRAAIDMRRAKWEGERARLLAAAPIPSSDLDAIRQLGAQCERKLAAAAVILHKVDAKTAQVRRAQGSVRAAERDTPDFNPACEACKKQPWKVLLDKMKADVGECTRELTELRLARRSALGLAVDVTTHDGREAEAEEQLGGTVAAVAGWLEAWRAHVADAPPRHGWEWEVSAATACQAWDEEDAVLKAAYLASTSAATSARQVAASARQASDRASGACEAVQARVSAILAAQEQERVEAQVREEEARCKAYREWQAALAAAEAGTRRASEACRLAEVHAEWEAARRDWTARDETITRLVELARSALLDTRACHAQADAEEVAATQQLRVAEGQHTLLARYAHERDVVWRPLAAALASERGAWAVWGPWRAQVKALEGALVARELADARAELDDARARVARAARVQALGHAVTRCAPAYVEMRGAQGELQRRKVELRELDERLGASRAAAAAQAKDAELVGVLSAYCDLLQGRGRALEWLEAGMAAYRAWLYREVVGPRLQREVNTNLSLLQGDTPALQRITLVGTWEDAKGAFLWEMKDGAVGTVARGKGGGYQRASIGLCMRLALARVSVVGTVSRHLFIDEGFTASDSDNMSRVPQFLAALLPRYDSIILVSHIDSLRDAADVVIGITQYSHGDQVLSRVQHGPRGEAAPAPRKIGRPRKAHA